jgi:zinc transporter ZupT
MGGEQAAGSPLAIVLGIVLDGVPESTVIGLTLVQGGAVSAAMIVAVFLSNLPEAVAATTGLASAGWGRRAILLLWAGVVFVSAVAALAGSGLFGDASPGLVAFVLSFAAGAILTMLADTMMPEASPAAASWSDSRRHSASALRSRSRRSTRTKGDPRRSTVAALWSAAESGAPRGSAPSVTGPQPGVQPLPSL